MVKISNTEIIGAMVIDLSTVRNLELAQNLQTPKSADCLYGLLNNTVTPMGARLLRSSIMQPLTEAPILDDRLDAVEELAQNMEMYSETRKGGLFYTRQISKLFSILITSLALSAFSDMDKLLTSVRLFDHPIYCERLNQFDHLVGYRACEFVHQVF